MNLLTIDRTTCQQCGICADVCPISIISHSDDGFPFVAEGNEKNCILCGHCDAVCSSQSLRHNTLPEMNLIRQDKLQEITDDNLSEYFRSRRSIRAFLPKAVNKKQLEEIFEVVNYSPTGVNHQMNKWIMISDAAIIHQLNSAVIEWMKGLIQTNSDLAKRLGCLRLVNSFARGNDVICRGARNVVIGYTDAAYPGGAIDSIIATSHLELLLPSFGLGGCWAGYLMLALRSSQEVRSIIGLDAASAVHSALMVGYPKYHYAKIPFRKEAQVTWM